MQISKGDSKGAKVYVGWAANMHNPVILVGHIMQADLE